MPLSKQDEEDVISYNQMTTEYLKRLCERGDFLTDYLTPYLCRWALPAEYPKECSFCTFFFSLAGMDRASVQKLENVRQFAARMPLTRVGIVFTWAFLADTFDRTPLEVDPTAIYYHLLLRTCTANTAPSIAPHISKIGPLLTEMRTCDLDDPKRLTQLAKELAVRHDVLMNGLKKGGCYGYDPDKGSRCIYSNTGVYDIACTGKHLSVDLRPHVSPNWVEKHHHVGSFYSARNYSLHQPSIGAGEDRASEPPTKTRGQITSLFQVEGELDRTDVTPDYFTRTQNARLELAQHLDYMYEIHRACFRPGPDTQWAFLSAEECVWCTLAIYPPAQRIFFDLVCMARERVLLSTMDGRDLTCPTVTGTDALSSKFHYGTADECQDECERDVETDRKKRAKGRTCKSSELRNKPDREVTRHTLRLGDMMCPPQAVVGVFAEWAHDKYPAMGEWLTDKMFVNDGHQIRDHCVGDRNVYCACNSRRMMYDTDCAMKKHHSCLLPLIVHCGTVLIRTRGLAKSAKILKGTLTSLIARHHLLTRLE